MFKINIEKKNPKHQQQPVVVRDVEVPALPSVGAYVSYDKIRGAVGYVESVDFWFPDDGSPCLVTVFLR